MLVGDSPEQPQGAQKVLHHVGRAVQYRLGRLGEDAPDLLLSRHRLLGEVVHLPDHRRLLEAVAENRLPVPDRLRVREARKNSLGDHLVQEAISPRHGLEEGLQVQVLDQVPGVGRRPRCDLEVAIAVHQERPHPPILVFRVSNVSPYFSAMARA